MMSEARPPAARSNPQVAKPRRLARFVPLGLLLAGLVLGYAMGWHHYLSLEFLAERGGDLRAYVADHRVSSMAAFFALYALAVAFSFPAASVLTVFGGFLFGCLSATLLVALAATLGATALFLAARSAFGDALYRKLGPRVARLADGFDRNAFGYLLVLRLAPVLPFWIVNIAPALFDVPLRTYVAATFVGILPGVLAYSYLGQGLEGVLSVAREAGRAPTLGDLVTGEITLAFVALALVAALPLIVRKLRKGAAAG